MGGEKDKFAEGFVVKMGRERDEKLSLQRDSWLKWEERERWEAKFAERFVV